ncbi:hypothetical protein [Dyadobacter aurulentus]|uniref:hypothetical protein n=1 Tax=Dyadobacter sp. UC 10 TaxID=2605428 RepID=UPI0011F2D7CE|nr:hypothetical protein [Dyadobacter sp. UC 10]KAA0993233.1 hypothetical protein FXO21_25180 [Dyadobacter sp. UC 10]
MRYIKDIANSEFKIGVYQWNNKYIVKIESGLFEQTYKIDDYEVQNIEELETCIDTVFMDSVRDKFEGMQRDFFGSLKRNNVLF